MKKRQKTKLVRKISLASVYAQPQVLLVDDDRLFRGEFREYFDEYDVLEASSGEQALAMLKKPNTIDVVVLDVVLPDARGTAMLNDIRSYNPDIKIIILTGHSSKDIAVEALRGHADEYIEKPFDVEKVKELIDSIVEKKRTGAEITAGDIDAKMEKVKRFIQRNCHKKISLRDAASAVYLSPKYLSRIFKQSTKVGFSDYRLHVKIEKAKGLLKRSALNINQIAEKMGYENAESFIRMFNKITGYTPTEYRAHHVKKARTAAARRR